MSLFNECVFKSESTILAGPKVTYKTAKSICKEQNTSLANEDELVKILRRIPDGNVYWLPYHKEKLQNWTWINMKIHSKEFF